MIEWSESFSVNNQGIDEQHKKLIGIIEEFVYLIKNKDFSFTNLSQILNELDNYVEEHFKYEEALMKKYSYLEAENHISEHNKLRVKIEEINIFDMENTVEFYQNMLAYLVDWLSKHIMHTDKKLGLFLNNL